MDSVNIQDDGRMTDEMTRGEFAEYLKKFEARFDRIDAKFDQIDAKFDQIDTKFEKLDEQFRKIDAKFDRIDTRFDRIELSMKVQFEDTRREIRLSFEANEAQREASDRAFAEMRHDHREQIDLLHTAVRRLHSPVRRRS